MSDPQRLGAGEVRRLLDSHGIEPSRALGQNFVVDPNTIDRIVSLAGVIAGDQVVEVGPGIGSLTVGLLDAGATVVAVEFDRHLLPALAEVTDGHPIRIVHGDAMDRDWANGLEGTWKMVANLPYNISTPLVLDVLEHVPAVTEIHVLVQREVADRLAAVPGTKDFGIPSVMRACWADARVVARVPATVFHPVPRVESAVISLHRHQRLADVDVSALRSLVNRAFGQRRKMLRKSLSGVATEDQMRAADIAPTARPEELTIDHWVRLIAAVQEVPSAP